MRKLQEYSLENYEKSRPANEQKIKLNGFTVRAYVDDKGTLHVLAHRDGDGISSEKDAEMLPLGYILGSNALMLKP